MVQINFAQKQVKAKVVYYGPGMSGKTTNLEVVHQRAPDTNRGDLTSISTDGDRTLFFDYMPLDLGTVAGMKTTFQIYTVPGQVYYNSTRKLVLQGVDGVVFVADSSSGMAEENMESLRNLEENLNEYGKSLATLPHVIQFNKRDLPDAMSVEELDRLLNQHGAPTFEGVANTGQGVFPTLKSLASEVLKNIMQERSSSGGGPALHQTGVHPAANAPAQPQRQAPQPPSQAQVPPPAPAPARQAPAPAHANAQSAPPMPGPPPAAPLQRTGFQPISPMPPAGPPHGGHPGAGHPGAGHPGAGAPGAGTPPHRAPHPSSAHETRFRNNPMMESRPQPATTARPRARGPQGKSAPSAARPATRRPERVEPERSKASALFTVAFVMLAGVVGALVARFVMSSL